MVRRSGKGKSPKTCVQAQPRKVPRQAEQPRYDREGFSWRFGSCDKGGPFCWAGITPDELAQALDRLGAFETMNDAQLRDTGSHPIPIAQLDKLARDRLSEIEQDDLDELFSLRLTGEKRIWCIRNEMVMRVLWWDPSHQVYPVAKDKDDRRKARRKRGA